MSGNRPQPRRLGIAPTADGCNRLLGRHSAIETTNLDSLANLNRHHVVCPFESACVGLLRSREQILGHRGMSVNG
jgi:hypothetical protein